MASSVPQDEPKPAATTGAKDEKLSDPALHVHLQVHLGRALQSIYCAVVEEPLPISWSKLLALLDVQQREEERAPRRDV
jgi:hypothetical protein